MKCHSCGIADSTHVKDIGTSRLVFAFGPLNKKRKQQYFIFCKNCEIVSVYVPSWSGKRRKFAGTIKDNREALAKLVVLSAYTHLVEGVPEEIVLFYIDGMIPLLKESIEAKSRNNNPVNTFNPGLLWGSDIKFKTKND